MQASSYSGETDALPKTRVWGSKPQNVHCSSATAPLRIELRWGCEECSEKTAVGSGVTFKYDPFDRRIEKISPTTTSIFAYDGDNLSEAVNASDSMIARYTQGQNIDEPLAMQRGATTDYYEQDGLGSVTSLTASNSAVAQSYTYDSFGNTTNSGGAVTNFFRYASRDLDTETGVYYYRARYYDNVTGRFLNEDPVRFESGADFYEYVLNDPVIYTDPTGLMISVCCRHLRYIVGKLGLNHCYIKITNDQGTHTYGLHREDSNNVLYPGGPRPVVDDPTDVGGTCKDVKGAKPCEERGCVQKFADPNCPSCGANYFVFTTNSNYWVSNALRSCGLAPPSFLSAPGYNYDPEAWIAISGSQPPY